LREAGAHRRVRGDRGVRVRPLDRRAGAPVIAYELRYAIAPDPTSGADESLYARWTPVTPPAVDAPGAISQVEVDGLLPQTAYSIGMRARGACGWSAPAFARVITGKRPYTQLSGCVIATAAYGSELDPDVAVLRRERDQAARRSGLVEMAALLYARSAPPRTSGTGPRVPGAKK